MAIVPYSKLMFIQRIRKHMNNGFPDDAFATSDKEIMLYVDASVAFQIVGLAYQNAKVEGVLAVAEAFLVTFNITSISQDPISGYYFATLPQPPLSLPLGYSVNHVYFADTANGVSQSANPIKAKRLSYRLNMPVPTGIRYWIENNTIWLAASNNYPLLNLNLYVQMPTARTTDLNAQMNLPDDILENIFNDVVIQLTKRYQEPKDIIDDGVPAGNNTVKS